MRMRVDRDLDSIIHAPPPRPHLLESGFRVAAWMTSGPGSNRCWARNLSSLTTCSPTRPVAPSTRMWVVAGGLGGLASIDSLVADVSSVGYGRWSVGSCDSMAQLLVGRKGG